jgi:hypothetical protein
MFVTRPVDCSPEKLGCACEELFTCLAFAVYKKEGQKKAISNLENEAINFFGTLYFSRRSILNFMRVRTHCL